MNTAAEQIHAMPETLRQSEKTRPYRIVLGGSVAEAIGGVTAVVLCILGLADVLPLDMAAVASIAIGAGLLFEAFSIGARYSQLWSASGAGIFRAFELGWGTAAVFLGGAGGVVLGLLAVLGTAPQTLVSVAAIGFGGALLFGSGAMAGLNYIEITSHAPHTQAELAANLAVSVATGLQVLIGLGAATLGILALVGFSPGSLTLIGLLCASAAAFVSGTALSTRISEALK